MGNKTVTIKIAMALYSIGMAGAVEVSSQFLHHQQQPVRSQLEESILGKFM